MDLAVVSVARLRWEPHIDLDRNGATILPRVEVGVDMGVGLRQPAAPPSRRLARARDRRRRHQWRTSVAGEDARVCDAGEWCHVRERWHAGALALDLDFHLLRGDRERHAPDRRGDNARVGLGMDVDLDVSHRAAPRAFRPRA